MLEDIHASQLSSSGGSFNVSIPTHREPEQVLPVVESGAMWISRLHSSRDSKSLLIECYSMSRSASKSPPARVGLIEVLDADHILHLLI